MDGVKRFPLISGAQAQRLERASPLMLGSSMLGSDPGKGLKVVFGYNYLIPDPANKWYRDDLEEEARGKDTMQMLQSPYITPAWMVRRGASALPLW